MYTERERESKKCFLMCQRQFNNKQEIVPRTIVKKVGAKNMASDFVVSSTGSIRYTDWHKVPKIKDKYETLRYFIYGVWHRIDRYKTYPYILYHMSTGTCRVSHQHMCYHCYHKLCTCHVRKGRDSTGYSTVLVSCNYGGVEKSKYQKELRQKTT